MSSSPFLDALRKNPFLGILRGIPLSHVPGIAKACHLAQISFLEVTMNTLGAPQIIGALRHACGSLGIEVGAGTVRTLEEFHIAHEAGAQFMVSPGFSRAVVEECSRHKLPCFPGALTPSEIQTAYEAGATCVKVFPVKSMGGPAYIKELRGPFQEIPLLACGGVDPKNAAEYFSAGVDAIAFGASIFRADWLQKEEYTKITSAIQQLRNAAGF
jgi:2-dehydro-3-deoxyphosphogluconate aldolase / (4S)-4-hydroxy-2-oxoglutarate aldolase